MSSTVTDYALDSSRSDILRAAATCFMGRGYAATSIDDVARSLGATKGRIYHHYPSKTDLFADVVRAGMDIIYEAIEPHRDFRGRAVERWRRMAFSHVMAMIETMPFQRAVWEGVSMHLRGAMTPEQRTVLEGLMQRRIDYSNIFRDVISMARDDGDLDFENLSIAIQMMFMTLNSPLFWYSPRPDETKEQRENLARQVVIFALRGLGAKKGLLQG